jgi:hypothetical protein
MLLGAKSDLDAARRLLHEIIICALQDFGSFPQGQTAQAVRFLYTKGLMSAASLLLLNRNMGLDLGHEPCLRFQLFA